MDQLGRGKLFVLGGALLAASCGTWVAVPGGGKQTLRIVTHPTGASVSIDDGEGERALGKAPTESVVGYEVERFDANRHCWWWPGISAATATAGGIVLGAAGLGQCVDSAGTVVGSSESSCVGEWRSGALNTTGVAGVAMLVAGGASTLLGVISCGLGEARHGDEHPVYRTVHLRASARGGETRETTVDVPSPVKDVTIALEPGHGAAPTAPVVEGDGDAPNLAELAKHDWLTGAEQDKSYALIVGVERYARTVPAPGARRDALQFRELCSRTLGVAEEHQRVALDQGATRSAITRHLRWLRSRLGRGGRLYFYFAGQGTAVGARGDPYLLPHDANPDALERTSLSTSWLLDELAATAATEVLAVVDAGFAGNGGRSAAMPGARPATRVAPPTVEPVVAWLGASTGTEIAGAGAEGEGGLLTVALTHGLGTGKADADRDGRITLTEITGWVAPRVSGMAAAEGRAQTPLVVLGKNVDPSVFVVAYGLSR